MAEGPTTKAMLCEERLRDQQGEGEGPRGPRATLNYTWKRNEVYSASAKGVEIGRLVGGLRKQFNLRTVQR